jgi:DNA-binding transcriptional regulator YiaG
MRTVNQQKQNAALIEAERTLDLGPVAMARAFGVSYATYKNWRSGRTDPPAVATRCLELLLAHPSATRKLALKSETLPACRSNGSGGVTAQPKK